MEVRGGSFRIRSTTTRQGAKPNKPRAKDGGAGCIPRSPRGRGTTPGLAPQLNHSHGSQGSVATSRGPGMPARRVVPGNHQSVPLPPRAGARTKEASGGRTATSLHVLFDTSSFHTSNLYDGGGNAVGGESGEERERAQWQTDQCATLMTPLTPPTHLPLAAFCADRRGRSRGWGSARASRPLALHTWPVGRQAIESANETTSSSRNMSRNMNS